MKPVNLYILSLLDSSDLFVSLLKYLSDQKNMFTISKHEINSIKELVSIVMEKEDPRNALELFNNFYVLVNLRKKFNIDLEEEFDLIKITKNHIINIELKTYYDKQTSQKTKPNIDKIHKQLVNHYNKLSHLKDYKMHFYSYETTEKKLRYLDADMSIKTVNIMDLISCLANIAKEEAYTDDIENLFTRAMLLVSPLTKPDRFLKGEYVLTKSQENIQRSIDDIIFTKDKKQLLDTYVYICVEGEAGTGKTLLLYDTAIKYSKSNIKCSIIHCGIEGVGHSCINTQTNDFINVYTILDFMKQTESIQNQYQIIFIDETQRLQYDQFDDIIKLVKKYKMKLIFFSDVKQVYTDREQKRSNKVNYLSLKENRVKKLNRNLRNNPMIIAFINSLLDTRNRINVSKNLEHNLSNTISIFYANNKSEAYEIIRYLCLNNYTFINYTGGGIKNKTSFDIYDDLSKQLNTHNVLGHEYDRVVMVMNEVFFYEGTILSAQKHPKDYLYVQMLYLGLTRAIDKVALVIVNNQELCENILSIFSNVVVDKNKIKIDKIEQLVNQQEDANTILEKIKNLINETEEKR